MQVIQRQIDDLRSNRVNVPAGAIMFFEGNCPDSTWTDLSASYAGRYVRLAGTYDVCDKQGENTDGSCVSVASEVTIKPSMTQSESNRRILGTFPGTDADLNMDSDSYVDTYKRMGFLTGIFDYVTSEQFNKNDLFKFPSDKNTHRWFSSSNYTFNSPKKFLRYIDWNSLSNKNLNSDPYWFLNSVDSKRILPTDTINDETRPKTIVLRACRAPVR